MSTKASPASPSANVNIEEPQPCPRCPHCDAEIGAQMGIYIWIMASEQTGGQIMVIASYCPHCRVILHQQLAPAGMPESGGITIPS